MAGGACCQRGRLSLFVGPVISFGFVGRFV